MAKRRANGEGSLRKRKDDRWESRYTAGNDPVTGKTIVKSILGKTQNPEKHLRVLQNVHRHSHPPQAGGYQAVPASYHGYPKAL